MLASPLQGFFESIFSAGPFSKLFELNGSVREWWFRWKLDRFVSISPPSRPPAARRMLTALCCSAGGDTWDVVCLHLPGASEAPGAVGEQRRGPLLCQDLQPAPLPLCRLFYSKTFIFSNAGPCRGDTAEHGAVPRGSLLALAELRFANEGLIGQTIDHW